MKRSTHARMRLSRLKDAYFVRNVQGEEEAAAWTETVLRISGTSFGREALGMGGGQAVGGN